jgi:hypothetical protein
VTDEELEALAKRAAAAKAANTAAPNAEYDTLDAELERAAMIALSKKRMKQGGGIESRDPFEGGVYDPRTGSYKNRNLISEQMDPPTRMDALIGGGMQGVGLNFGDEAIGSLARVVEGSEYGPLRREQTRARLDAAEEQNRWTYIPAEIGGNVLTAGAALPVATAPTLGGTMLRGAGLGAAEGAAYGFGEGEGGAADRTINAAKTAAIGGGIGGMVPPVTAMGAKTASTIWDLLSSRVNKGNGMRARRAIEDTLKDAGLSIDDASRAVGRAAADGQPEYRLMDALGMPGMRKASGITRKGGPASEELQKFLMERQIDAPDRMVGYVDDAFGLAGKTKTRKMAEEMVRGNRKKVADTMFDRAADDAAPVDVRNVISMLDDTIVNMSNSGIKPPAVVKEFQKLRDQLGGYMPDGAPTTLSDYQSVLTIWRELRDQIDAAYKTGGPGASVGDALKPVRDALRSSLEESSDLFRFGTDNYREGSKVLESFQTGADMMRGGRADDTVPVFNALTDQQKKAARIGYGDKLAERVEGIAAEAPNVSRHSASTKRKAEAAAMALDPDLYSRRIGREADIYRTFNRALGGSKTADNLQDIADVGILADLARGAGSVATGNFGSAGANLWNAAKPYVTGDNEGTQKLVAQLLKSANPAKDLAPVAKQAKTREAIKRMIDAMLRNSARDPALNLTGLQ